MLNLTNFVSIKNYQAGKNGNMLLSYNDTINLDGDYASPKGDARNINALLCTAYAAPETEEFLKGYMMDDVTPYDKVIVVSKKFMKLGNKRQLALLEIQNAAASYDDPLTNVSRRVYGEVAAIEKYGMLPTKLAIAKEHRMMERSVFKASKGLHSQYKKDIKIGKSINMMANILGEDDDELGDELSELLKGFESRTQNSEPSPTNA